MQIKKYVTLKKDPKIRSSSRNSSPYRHKKMETTKITLMDYDESNFLEKEVKLVEESFPFKDKPTVTWINIDGIHEIEIMKR